MNYLNMLKVSLLRWEQAFFNAIPKFVLAIILLVIFIFIGRWLKRLSLKFYTRILKGNSNMASIISSTTYFIVLLIGVFIVLEFVGLEKMVTNVLAGAGVIGIVAGFAFKDIASNLFAGLLLKFQDPFKATDWVSICDTYGRVLNVGWLMTHVSTITGQKVYIPNQLIFNNSFTNYSSFGKRRVVFESGVSYGDDLELVRKAALEEARKVKGILLNEEIDFYFTSIGGYSYNFMLRFWIKFSINKDYWEAMSEIIMRIKKRFEAENISLAYPVTTLDFGVKGGVNIFDKPMQITQKPSFPKDDEPPARA